uniref:Uncharacterized protein n=1 Tax=Oryza barthii TaxID=65489 RepID=A0A0D3F1B3_9ORYZ
MMNTTINGNKLVTVDSAMEAKIGATAMVLLLLAFGASSEAKKCEYCTQTFKGICIHDDRCNEYWPQGTSPASTAPASSPAIACAPRSATELGTMDHRRGNAKNTITVVERLGVTSLLVSFDAFFYSITVIMSTISVTLHLCRGKVQKHWVDVYMGSRL